MGGKARCAPVVLCAAITVLLALSGCVSVQPASPLRGQTGSALGADGFVPIWPTRDAAWAQAEAKLVGHPAVIVRSSVQRDGTTLIPTQSEDLREIVAGTTTDTGIVLEVIDPAPQTPTSGDDETAGSLPEPQAVLVFASRRGSADADMVTAPLPGTVVKQKAPGTAAKLPRVGGICLDVQPSLKEGPPVGIVIHLRGLAGSEYEQPVVDALRAVGYVGLATEFPWNRWRPQTLDLGTEQDVAAAAAKLAEMADDCLAEAAYAIDGAVQHLWSTRPELRGKPVVLIGCSAGSLALPAAAARLGSRTSAAVFVGSGCNIVHIAQTSELTNGGLQVLIFGKPVTGAMAGLLSGEYIRRSSLDPYHTATLLRNVPVLQIHSAGDGIIPAVLGEDLYEQLGRPERWMVRGGHRVVFLRLAGLKGDIREWVERALQTGAVAETKANGQTSAVR